MIADRRVKDCMTTKFVTLKTEMSVMEAIKLLLHNRVTGAPVTDTQGQVIGMFTEMDCMKVVVSAAYDQNFDGKVGEFMSEDVPTVNSETSLAEAAEKFSKSTVRNFPVMEDVELAGIISRHDVLREMVNHK